MLTLTHSPIEVIALTITPSLLAISKLSRIMLNQIVLIIKS